MWKANWNDTDRPEAYNEAFKKMLDNQKIEDVDEDIRMGKLVDIKSILFATKRSGKIGAFDNK